MMNLYMLRPSILINMIFLIFLIQCDKKSELITPRFSYPNVSMITVGDNVEIIPTVEIQPTEFAISPDLPDGIVLDSTTGIISGIPKSTLSNTEFTVKGKNDGGIFTIALNIQINPISKPLPEFKYNATEFVFKTCLNINPISPTNQERNEGGYTVSPALPEGLNFDTAKGIISGKPSVVHAPSVFKIKRMSVDVFSEVNLTIEIVKPLKIWIKDMNFRRVLKNRIPFAFTSEDSLMTDNSYFLALTSLEVSDGNIISLEGVECFSGITNLECNNNRLSELDVSGNKLLTTLSCSNNRLKVLDVSKNTALTKLGCLQNQLTQLDVSKNTQLTELTCGLNSLTSLQLANNPLLKNLVCYNNSLESLDISKNLALTRLECQTNNLTSLDLSAQTKWDILYVVTQGVGTNNKNLTSLKVNVTEKQNPEIKAVKTKLKTLDHDFIISTYNSNLNKIECLDYNPEMDVCNP